MGAYPKGLADVRQGPPPSRLRLLAPLRYLAIYNPEKARYDFAYPIVCGSILWLAYLLLAPRVALFGSDGLVQQTRDILIMGVPFMVGALAAVAMGSPGQYLDRRPIGVELYLDGRCLTLRQFVCYLLGYMCFLGLVLLGATSIAALIKPAVIGYTAGHPELRELVRAGGALFLMLGLSALTVTNFWSLYFLTEIVSKPAGTGQ